MKTVCKKNLDVFDFDFEEEPEIALRIKSKLENPTSAIDKYTFLATANIEDSIQDRASMIAEEDRISNLPDEIIHHVLSFIDMRYAVQTSTLSKNWKHIWTSMPHLNFNTETCRTLSQYAEFVRHALSHRNHRAEVSAVELTCTGKKSQDFVKSILKYAYLHNVRQLSLTRLSTEFEILPHCLFSSHTLKHLTIATKGSLGSWNSYCPKSASDFPALETLNLSNMRFDADKSLNPFSKFVNLKDLTLHICDMGNVDIFNICAPQLFNLTITNPDKFPKVFNVVAPQLQNLTASVSAASFADYSYLLGWVQGLQFSTDDFDSLEKVNLSLPTSWYKREIYVPRILDLFRKFHSTKFLILDVNIIKTLSSCLDQLLCKPCPFDNLKCLKIDTVSWERKELIETMPTQLRNYLLGSSPCASFVMDLPQSMNQKYTTLLKSIQSMEDANNNIYFGSMETNAHVNSRVPRNISRQHVDKDTMAKNVAKQRERSKRRERVTSTHMQSLRRSTRNRKSTMDKAFVYG